MYDALNVLNALDIIIKDSNKVIYNPFNTTLPDYPLDEDNLEACDEEIVDPIALEEEKVRIKNK